MATLAAEYWAALPPKQKLAVAAKAGAWAEFLGERAWNTAKPYVKRGVKYETKVVKRYGKKIRKAIKPRKSSRKKAAVKDAVFTIGVPPRLYKNPQSFETYNFGVVSFNSHTLYGVSLSTLPRTTVNDRSQRQRDVVSLESVSYQFDVKNKTGNAMQCNIAVVAPKFSGALFNTTGYTLFGKFFRSPGSTNSRYVDFAATTDDLDKHRLPINSDRFIVLSHKRFTLNFGLLGNGIQYDQDASNFKQVSEYIRIGKEARYSTDNEPESGRIYLVFWFSGFQSASTSVDAVTCLIKGRGSFKEVC